MRRHGELSQLRAARRQLRQQQQGPRRLGRLSPERGPDEADIEFQLSTDSRQLQVSPAQLRRPLPTPPGLFGKLLVSCLAALTVWT